MQAACKAMPLLVVINGLSERYGKRYCYPSQVKLLELLGKRLQVNMSIATLNRHLRVVEDAGYLRRIRRIRRDENLGTVFQSSIYILKKKGYLLLAKAGLVAWRLVKEALEGKGVGEGRGGAEKRRGGGQISDVMREVKARLGIGERG